MYASTQETSKLRKAFTNVWVIGFSAIKTTNFDRFSKDAGPNRIDMNAFLASQGTLRHNG